MTSILEPTCRNVLLCGVLLIVSGGGILAALRRFGMKLASTLFSFLIFVIGMYIPFYLLGTVAMNAVTAGSSPTFSFFFLRHQLRLLNAPFALFESASFIMGVIAVLAVIAVIIAAVFVVKIVIRAIRKAQYPRFFETHTKKFRLVCRSYIPNYHNTYLVIGRLRN